MNWLWLVSYFLGGVFTANAIPHFVAGTMGRPFQSPFAKPPGKGLSSSTLNVVWGFFNAVVGYLLVARVGAFDPRATSRILRSAWVCSSSALPRRVTSASFMEAIRRRGHEEPSVRRLTVPNLSASR